MKQNAANYHFLVSKYRECVRNQDLLVSSQAIKSVGLIGLRHHFAVEAVTQILLDLLKSENDVVIDNALQSLQGF